MVPSGTVLAGNFVQETSLHHPRMIIFGGFMLPATLASQSEHLIHEIRGHRVMIGSDIARLYGVTTFNLHKAVNRNLDRFPADFMFRLTASEHRTLIFQTGIPNREGRGGNRFLPFAFTQEGVAMLSSVLRSPRAVRVNIEIMRAFVRHRRVLADIPGLGATLRRLESALARQGKTVAGNSRDIRVIFEIIERLIEGPEEKRKRIGFSA